MKKLILVLEAIIVFMFSFSTVYAREAEVPKNLDTDKEECYIYSGDSRFVQMNRYCGVDKVDNVYCVSKGAMGHKWLNSDAIPEIEKLLKDDTKHWNLILGFGINDLRNIDKYIETYTELSAKENCTVYIVSTNQVEYHSNITNEKVDDFNQKIKAVPNTIYIDTFTYLKENGFKTVDGVHYDIETYNKIYGYILECIQNVEIISKEK